MSAVQSFRRPPRPLPETMNDILNWRREQRQQEQSGSVADKYIVVNCVKHPLRKNAHGEYVYTTSKGKTRKVSTKQRVMGFGRSKR